MEAELGYLPGALTLPADGVEPVRRRLLNRMKKNAANFTPQAKAKKSRGRLAARDSREEVGEVLYEKASGLRTDGAGPGLYAVAKPTAAKQRATRARGGVTQKAGREALAVLLEQNGGRDAPVWAAAGVDLHKHGLYKTALNGPELDELKKEIESALLLHADPQAAAMMAAAAAAEAAADQPDQGDQGGSETDGV